MKVLLVGSIMPPDASIKVPLKTALQTVPSLGWAIRRLSYEPAERLRMGRAAWEFARTQTWAHRADIMSGLYEGVARKQNASGEADKQFAA